MTEAQAKKLAEEMLTEKRFNHCAQVALMAEELARQNGVKAEKARTASWLHDVLKEKSLQELTQIASDVGITTKELKLHPQATWHAMVAAPWLQKEHALDDVEILSAIACHTVGKVGMSVLDKVIYVADAVNRGRNYAGVQELRKLAMRDLDLGAKTIMLQNIDFLQKRQRPIDPATRKALEDLNMFILRKRQSKV